MAYNTGNPIGSIDPRDAADNKENFEKFALSTDPTYLDRLGVERKTVTGALQDYAAYNPRGEWTTATAYNINDVWRDGTAGAFYLVLADYTSGASAAADIAGGNVAVHQPKNWVVSVNTIADLRALEPAFDGQQVELLGHTVAGVGSGMFYADYSSSAADDNGITIVTAGGRRWVRSLGDSLSLDHFGVVRNDSLTDNASIIEQAIASAKSRKVYKIIAGPGEIYTSGNHIIDAGVHIQGVGWTLYSGQKYGTRFRKFGSGTNPIFKLNGTSAATLSYLQVFDDSTAHTDGIILLGETDGSVLCTQAILDKVGVYGNWTAEANIGIKLYSETASYYNKLDCYIEHCGTGIRFDKNGNGNTGDLIIKSCRRHLVFSRAVENSFRCGFFGTSADTPSIGASTSITAINNSRGNVLFFSSESASGGKAFEYDSTTYGLNTWIGRVNEVTQSYDDSWLNYLIKTNDFIYKKPSDTAINRVQASSDRAIFNKRYGNALTRNERKLMLSFPAGLSDSYASDTIYELKLSFKANGNGPTAFAYIRFAVAVSFNLATVTVSPLASEKNAAFATYISSIEFMDGQTSGGNFGIVVSTNSGIGANYFSNITADVNVVWSNLSDIDRTLIELNTSTMPFTATTTDQDADCTVVS